MSAAMFWCNIYICHFRSIFLEMPNKPFGSNNE